MICGESVDLPGRLLFLKVLVFFSKTSHQLTPCFTCGKQLGGVPHYKPVCLINHFWLGGFKHSYSYKNAGPWGNDPIEEYIFSIELVQPPNHGQPTGSLLANTLERDQRYAGISNGPMLGKGISGTEVPVPKAK